MGVKGNLKLIFNSFWLNIKKEWKYKASFFMQIFTMIVNDFFFIIEWVVIFGIVDDVAGYGFNDIMLLWAVSAGTFGFCGLFFGGVRNIKDLIYEGKLDVYLTQPKSVLINLACSHSSLDGMGDIIYSFIILIIIGAPWYWYFLLVPIIIVGGILLASIYVVFSSISFYIKNGDGSKISEKIILGADKYPFGIWNTAIKFMLSTIFPVLFYTIVPAQYIIKSFNIWWMLAYLAVTAFWVLLAFILFNIGLKKYNSGNLMGGRL